MPAITAVACLIFTPFFTAVYIVERLALQTSYDQVDDQARVIMVRLQ